MAMKTWRSEKTTHYEWEEGPLDGVLSLSLSLFLFRTTI